MYTTAHGGFEAMASPVPKLDPRVERLAAALSEGVMLVRDGCVVWANERLGEMAGRGAALAGLKLADLLADRGDGLPRRDHPRTVECALRRPDVERTVLCRCAWPECEGEPGAWVVEDVTHVRTLERELLRSGQELALMNRESAGLRERLRSERSEREELLSVVSHELRTPVTVISGYNRLLLGEEVGPLTDEQRRFLEESGKSCRRLDAFIGNLLEASRAAKGDEILELGSGSMATVVENVASMFRPLLAEHGLTLTVNVEGECRARFDPLRIEQVLTNLVGNAVRYAGANGRIEIAAGPRREGERDLVEVSVSDDGPGVAPEDRERIFRPYVQAGEESRAGGLGLGLAICKRLVEAHGGRITLSEPEGGGSRFAFTLLTAPPAAPEA